MMFRLALFSTWCFFNVACATGQTWPDVAPMKTIVKVPDAKTVNVVVDILGRDKSPLYRAQCRSSNYEGDEFDYSGDFECRLVSLYSKERYSTLFTDNPNQTRDWESRARFFTEDLIGLCSNYPDFGRRREFRLRGMRIVLEVDDVRTRGIKPALESLSFALEVIIDKSATAPISMPSDYKEPPLLHPNVDMQRDCTRVIRER